MGDIVTRLRNESVINQALRIFDDEGDISAEAADEIERLRNQVRQLEAERDQWQKMAVRNDS